MTSRSVINYAVDIIVIYIMFCRKYSAAQQDYLFDDLTIAADISNKLPTGLTIKDIMDTWTLKPGFPLVRVSRASPNRIYVSQVIN